MCRFLVALGLATAAFSQTAHPPTLLIATERPREHSGRRIWYASLAALAVSNTLDIASSWRRHELNPPLAGPNGNFTWQSAGIKIGIQLPAVIFQLWWMRRHPSAFSYRTFGTANFVLSGTFAGAAVHNFGVR